MIRKLFIYTTLALGLSACSVDELYSPSGLGSDGELTVNLAVPGMEIVGTRASEDAVANVTMLVLDETGVAQIKSFSGSEITSSGNRHTVSCELNSALRTKSGLKLYFIANVPQGVSFTSGLSEGELQEKTSEVMSGSNMVMSGYASLSDIVGGTKESVALKRNGAKVTVTDAKIVEGEYVPGDNAYNFQVFGTAENSSVVAATFAEDSALPSSRPVNVTADDVTTPAEPYFHPTENNGRDDANRPFIIVKAPYSDGKEYFYRVEFEKVDKDAKTVTPLNLNSNHWYQVMILEVGGKGDTTAAAAAKNPTSLLKTDIYDYCPQAFNLITDGTRELGVSHEVAHSGNATTAETQKSLYVRLYSLDASEMNIEDVSITTTSRWLTLGTPQPAEASEFGSMQGQEAFKGVLYKIPVDFSNPPSPGELNGKIIVSWKGLTREVPVIWSREFNGAELCTAKLTIKDNTGTTRYSTTGSEDYWYFVHNVCHGLKKSENNDKVRDAGLHFPLNYGGPDARWSYEYTVEFNDLNNGKPYNWKIETTGIKGITLDNYSGNNKTGKLEINITHDPSVANWEYEVGKLTLTITSTEDGSSTDCSLDLYHTGFFDRPTVFRGAKKANDLNPKDYRIDRTDTDDDFYYYEVIEGPAGTYHWLDRNLGARAANPYCMGEGNISVFGTESAAGGYYMAAKYNNGGEPIMYSNLCPPGYEIPRQDIWNTLRNSPNFQMNRYLSDYNAEFTNAKGQKVYFSKSRYYDATTRSLTGDSKTGYYWTSTPSEGFEKDHIGNWLKYLKIAGSIASYDNAEVNGRKESNGFALSVRCVNITQNTTTKYRTHFNVAGATHVFLYSLDTNGNRNAVTNWPGQAIGNYLTMGNPDNYFNFVYESPNTRPEQFYVIFTFRSEDGVWHSMSKGEGNTTVYSRDKKPSELNGWKVVGDTWVSPTGSSQNTVLGGSWICSYNSNDETASVTFSPNPLTIQQTTPEGMYSIYYTNPNNWGEVYVYWYNPNNGDENNGWPGYIMTKMSDGRYRSCIPKDKNINIIFNNGNNGNGNETNPIPVIKNEAQEYSAGPK
ncbi:MAG: starch-binding protein [Muribaculaceae bacterium]|nr:starch-binding protein [Muribaculaceae bacterium]